MTNIEQALAVNSPLWREIDQIVQSSARAYASRREGGVSESMNPSLDYVAGNILEAVKRALS